MRIVKVGDRGAAVEDIQRRLLALGYDIGPTGVDGVFLEGTAEAVHAFQVAMSLYADGVVGPRTWSALVDSTFGFGDRMLYLRTPYFHGKDVHELQRALNSLGFACGNEDAMFGTFTERAVVEFQQNAGLGADGIVGPATFGALNGLRHIWSPRSSGAHSQAHGAPADRAAALPSLAIRILSVGPMATEIARRMANVADASTSDARVGAVPIEGRDLAELLQAPTAVEALFGAEDAPAAVDGSTRLPVTVVLVESESIPAEPVESAVAGAGLLAVVIPYLPERTALARAIGQALRQVGSRHPAIVIAIGNESFSKGSKQGVQRAATTILDAVCLSAR